MRIRVSAKIAMIRLRILETDENGVMHGDTLETAIEEDVAEHFVPVFVSATVGTTGICAFDPIEDILQCLQKV